MRALYYFNSPTSLNNGLPESLSAPATLRLIMTGGLLFSDGAWLKKYKTRIKSLYYYYYYNTYLQIFFERLKFCF